MVFHRFDFGLYIHQFDFRLIFRLFSFSLHIRLFGFSLIFRLFDFGLDLYRLGFSLGFRRFSFRLDTRLFSFRLHFGRLGGRRSGGGFRSFLGRGFRHDFRRRFYRKGSVAQQAFAGHDADMSFLDGLPHIKLRVKRLGAQTCPFVFLRLLLLHLCSPRGFFRKRGLLFRDLCHHPLGNAPCRTVHRRAGHQGQKRDGVVVVAVLVFHEQMQRHRAAEKQHTGVQGVRLAAEERDAVNARAQEQKQIIQIADVHHPVQQAFPIRRQVALLIQEQDVPGRAVVVVAPEHLKLMDEQVQQRPGVYLQPFQRHVAADHLGFLSGARGVQRGVEIFRVVLIPAAVAFQVQAHQQVIAVGRAARQFSVDRITGGHGEKLRENKVNGKDCQAALPALVGGPQAQRNIVSRQRRQRLFSRQQANDHGDQENDRHGTDEGSEGQHKAHQA